MILGRFKKAILLNRIAKLKLSTISEIESILRKHVFPQRAGSRPNELENDKAGSSKGGAAVYKAFESKEDSDFVSAPPSVADRFAHYQRHWEREGNQVVYKSSLNKHVYNSNMNPNSNGRVQNST